MSSNKTGMRIAEICADCGSLDPSWALVNRGLLVCDECCSVHRSLGRHISQVKSLKKSHWSPSQRAMVNSLNTGGVNNLWEHSLGDVKKRKPTPKDPVHPTKAEFIKAKHQQMSWVPRSNDSEDELHQGLHSSVRTGNLETSLRLLAQGASPNYHHPEKGNCALHVAAKAGQIGQVELLLTHGADPSTRDSSGSTPAQCARLGGHREVGMRLSEVVYEVTDRLTYFLTKQRPDHPRGIHFVLPSPSDCLVQPQPPNNQAATKLKQLTNTQFEDLAMDVYDEVDRRETESIWCLSGASLEHGSVPFLPVNPELSTMRNQGRQKLATCSMGEFAALVLDILTEAKRRHTTNDRLSAKPNQKESDEEPLYDSVASDEDYATAEQLATLVALNAKGLPLSVCEVGSGRNSQQLDQQHTELKEKLALSETRANLLSTQLQRLNARIEEISLENRQLKAALKQPMGLGRSGGSAGGSLGAAAEAEPTEPVSEARGGSQRPASMYETRENLRSQVGSMPASEEVMRRTGQVTRRIQELWNSMKPPDHSFSQQHHAFVPCAERIRVAVAELTAIFPQKSSDEVVQNALRQLNTNTMKLQGYCTELEKSAEQVRTSAFVLAQANRQIITRFQ